MKRGNIWYFRLANGPKRIPHSTGKTLKVEVAKYADEVSKQGFQSPVSMKRLREYLPEALEKHIQMSAADGDPLDESHCQDYRRYIRYILSDKIADLSSIIAKIGKKAGIPLSPIPDPSHHQKLLRDLFSLHLREMRSPAGRPFSRLRRK